MPPGGVAARGTKEAVARLHSAISFVTPLERDTQRVTPPVVSPTMSKKEKKQPEKQAAPASPPSSSARVTRLRDLEEDVFDVAHNNLLRTAAELPITGRRQIVHSADWDASSSPTREVGKGANASTALVLKSESGDEPSRTQVQSAVQATWEKANALQEQAVNSAVRAAVREAHDQADRELSAALKTQEEELRAEAEQANRRLWEIAAREKEAAIAKAIEDQVEECKNLRKEIDNQRERTAEELENTYHSLKSEVGRVLEEQHTTNINMAVQAAWERAARLEETAVANARKEAKAEAERDWEKRMALEQHEGGEKLRKSVTEAQQASTDELQSNREELRSMRQEMDRLKQELEREQLTAREAESKAAKQQQQAVEAAVKAVEAVAKGAQERAVAKAVAELQKSMAAATVDK